MSSSPPVAAALSYPSTAELDAEQELEEESSGLQGDMEE